MRIKIFISIALIAAIAISITSCANKNEEKQVSKEQNAETGKIIDNKDEMTFLRTFLDSYIHLTGKEAQALARKHLTQDFYSNYIEHCNNQDNAVDLICELNINEKIEKVDTIMKGIEDPSSFIVQVQAVDDQAKPFTVQYDMTVVNENGFFKLSDSQIFD